MKHCPQCNQSWEVTAPHDVCPKCKVELVTTGTSTAAPSSPRDQQWLQEICELVKNKMPESHSFVVFAFPHSQTDRIYYASSAERAGVIEALKVWIDYQEKVATWMKHDLNEPPPPPPAMPTLHGVMDEPPPSAIKALKYALSIAQGRRVLNRNDSYLAAVSEIELFLMAALERLELGESMEMLATVQGKGQGAAYGTERIYYTVYQRTDGVRCYRDRHGTEHEIPKVP